MRFFKLKNYQPLILLVFCLAPLLLARTGFFSAVAQEVDPEQLNRSMNWYHNALHHYESGEPDKAAVCLDKALEIYSGNPRARELLATINSGGSTHASGPAPSAAPAQNETHLKTCSLYRRILAGGLEMYAMDRMETDPIPAGPISAESPLGRVLTEDAYVEEIPVCPGGGTYMHRGGGSVYCTVHGDETAPGGGVFNMPPAPATEDSPGNASEMTPEESLRKAGKMIREGRYSGALPLAEAANAALESADTLNVLGFINEKLGIYDEAIRYYQKAMEKEPDNPAFANNFAFACANAGILLSKALDQARRAVELSPTSEHFHDTLGFCLLKSRDYQGAQREFRKALELSPEFHLPTYHLSFVDTAAGKLADAVEKLDRVVQANPDFLPALTRKAVLKYETGDLQTAAELFQQILKQEPEHSQSLFYLGFILLSQQNAEAPKFFQAVTMANPNSAESFLSQALVAQEQRGSVREIYSLFRSAIEARPSWWLSRFALATGYQAQGDAEKALNEARAALRLAEPHLVEKLEQYVDTIEQSMESGSYNWYENAEWRYRFALPGPDWEVTEDTDQFMVPEAQVVLVKQDEGIGRFALIAVIVQDNPELYTSDDVVAAWDEELRRMVPGYQRLGIESVEVDKAEGKVLVYEQEHSRVTKHAFISFGKNLLTLVVTDNKEHFDDSLKVYERLLKTFHFL